MTRDIPFIDAAQMVEVDRMMVEDYRIWLIQMMENAGRALARLAQIRFLAEGGSDRRIMILAGTGGNGGGALAAARHLHNWGCDVEVVLARPARDLDPVPWHQLDILRHMKVKGAGDATAPSRLDGEAALIIDGLIGYSLKGRPREPIAGLIRRANEAAAPILALDVPSGLDAATGAAFDPVIKATATLTLALPKSGLKEKAARNVVGELYLADISVPPQLYAMWGLEEKVKPIFSENEIVRIW